MNALRRLGRAEYAAQPAQLPRRAWRTLRRLFARGRLTVRLPWGYPLSVDPRESIGRSIVALNVQELLVTEALWRLLDPGECAADVGANVGYMTSEMAARAGAGGSVWAFEPVPELAQTLRGNVAAWRGLGGAPVRIEEAAATDGDGPVELALSENPRENAGTAGLAAVQPDASRRRITVAGRTLDAVFGDGAAPHVLKVDVEGAEALVFRGARRMLGHGAIRDVIFEEWRPLPAASVEHLRAHGYAIGRVERGRRGPEFVAAETPPASGLDAPTYLATRDPERVRMRFAALGWSCLRGNAR